MVVSFVKYHTDHVSVVYSALYCLLEATRQIGCKWNAVCIMQYACGVCVCVSYVSCQRPGRRDGRKRATEEFSCGRFIYRLLADHYHLVPRSRMRGTLSPLPQYAFIAWCSVKATGTTLPFTYTGVRVRHEWFCGNTFHQRKDTGMKYVTYSSVTGSRYVTVLPCVLMPAHERTRVYPKVSGLAAWSENFKWYSSLPLGAIISLFCESV
jgi:hypothetical protein